MQIPSVSKEWIKAVITTDEDPTFGTVSFAIVDPGVEPTTEWVAGEWETATPAPKRGEFYRAVARVLVGPGTLLAMSNGTYAKWVRVTSADEDVVRYFGRVTFT